MFELAISQQKNPMRQLLGIYFPIVNVLFVSDIVDRRCVLYSPLSTQPDLAARTVKRCHKVIWRVAGAVVQEKKKRVEEAFQSGKQCEDKDLLALMRTFVLQRVEIHLTGSNQ